MITAKIKHILCVISMLSLTFGTTISTFTEDMLPKGSPTDNAIAMYIGSGQALINNIEMPIDPLNAEVMPFIKNGKTLAPIRFIGEKLGAKITWNEKNNSVTMTSGEKNIEIPINSNKIIIDNKTVTTNTTTEIYCDRAFAPIRVIAESLGKKVFFERNLVIISDRDNTQNLKNDKSMLDSIILKVNRLPIVGDKENLEKILANLNTNHGIYYALGGGMPRTLAVPASAKSDAKSIQSTSEAIPQNDYSKTNVQVEGVDEADIVKTDGKYIYQVNKQKILIIEAYPADKMNLVNSIDFTDENFYPREIYVDNNYLTVIGDYTKQTESQNKKVPSILPYYIPSQTFTKTLIFDITDKKKEKQLKDFEIEGSYISSRKINMNLYVVANKFIDTFYIKQSNTQNIAPQYRDSLTKNEYTEIPLSSIRYFPRCVDSNFLTIIGMDISNSEKNPDISSYLGSGNTIYASQKNLYITMPKYNLLVPQTLMAIEPQAERLPVTPVKPSEKPDNTTTVIYKFGLNKGNVSYLAKGEVPGTIINQFSMDENNSDDNGEFFRITTTKEPIWLGMSENVQSTNNLYILDQNMNLSGSIEDIAPGEKIYSVRFINKRAYMVTFKTVDPLFVIDLSSPTNPKILGALKIPGFSDYLHPYDENHIIGFGKDTVEGKNTAYYLGFKMAIFDVSDVNNPKQQFTENIGDRGTDSELLRNHKALLFSKDKNLLALPITLMELQSDSTSSQKGDAPQYGQFTYQGAYVYNIDLQKGFTLKGKITHLSNEDLKKASTYSFDADKQIDRILYIGDTLYTLSAKYLKANNFADLKDISYINLN